jgi:hypothetical protein
MAIQKVACMTLPAARVDAGSYVKGQVNQFNT